MKPVQYYHDFLTFQRLNPELTLERLHPVNTPKGPELIVNYDEHVLVNHFKFGLIYQRIGQSTEEQLFGNRIQSEALEEFLEVIGQKIKLKEHKGSVFLFIYFYHKNNIQK